MSTPTFPAGRYGRRRSASRTPRWMIVVAVCLVIAVTSTLAYSAYRRQSSEVQASVSRYAVSATNVRVTFEVTKPRNEPATCVLRARDVKGTVVGQARVPVPSAPRRVTLTHTLPTRGRAIGAEVLRCSLGAG